MPQTILFVDEEKFVHKALKRSFRKMREEWDMRFAAGPSEAMEILNQEPIDVVVTETVFQGQSGLDFLKVVRERHPNSVRIILSGYSNQDVILESVDLAHQYLSKPCEDEALKATINRAFMMKELLKHRALKEIVSQIDSLPTLPAIYVELVDELESEDASIEKIGDVISKDIGLTVKILKMVNSSFFGLRQQITSPAKAVSLLGLDLIKAIVLTHGTFDKFKNLKYPGLSLEKMWEHAMITGALAKIIAKEGGQDRKASDTAFMAGLLHDIGRLLIAAYLPDSYRVIAKRIEEKSIPMAEAETEIIGTTHAAVGAYLIGLWGLPDAIIEAAAFHHAPKGKNLTTAAIVHLANAFAKAGQKVRQHGDIFEDLDYAYLEEANILPNLEDFWAACADHLVVEEPA
jgi:putative nucleotidyltransferase with HDIG domain